MRRRGLLASAGAALLLATLPVAAASVPHPKRTQLFRQTAQLLANVPSLRVGQALVLAACEMGLHPSEPGVCKSKICPFSDDARIPAYLAWIEERDR